MECLAKIVNCFLPITVLQNAPSLMFDTVLNMPLLTVVVYVFRRIIDKTLPVVARQNKLGILILKWLKESKIVT